VNFLERKWRAPVALTSVIRRPGNSGPAVLRVYKRTMFKTIILRAAICKQAISRVRSSENL
jgi:hypothetical protein